ncbi:MAG: DUF933 domain-containing protein [Planctomycetes bacterium]|nr:DUF933 domain-containing protein [Planctomycetota bacterium]
MSLEDPQLLELARIEDAQSIVRIQGELWDIPSFVGMPGKAATTSLVAARAAEGLLLVARAQDPSAVREATAALDAVWDELRLLDRIVMDGRLQKLRADDKRARKDPEGTAREGALLERCLAAVGSEAGAGALTEGDRAAAGAYGLFTSKPAIGVLNLETEGLSVHADAWRLPLAQFPAGAEAEILDLPEEEQAAYRSALGRAPGVGSAVWPFLHEALGRMRFFTASRKETRSWSVRKGATALEAAGAIHSDLARGFVRAEWVPRESFVKLKGWEAAKRAGAVRLVSRDHVLADGDILHSHFSV